MVCASLRPAIPIDGSSFSVHPGLRDLPAAPEKLSRNDDCDDADWESAFELEGRLRDRELTLGDIDIAD